MPDYFAAMGIPVKQGRSFIEQDRIGSQAVMVIDQNLARQYWPGSDAVGKRMRRSDSDSWATIVGVVAAVRRTRLIGAESDTEGVIGAGKGVFTIRSSKWGTRISMERVQRPHICWHARAATLPHRQTLFPLMTQ